MARDHFSSEVAARAFEWIKRHPSAPMDGLDDNDDALVAYVTEVAMRSEREPTSRASLEINALELERGRVERRIAAMSADDKALVELQRERANISEKIARARDLAAPTHVRFTVHAANSSRLVDAGLTLRAIRGPGRAQHDHRALLDPSTGTQYGDSRHGATNGTRRDSQVRAPMRQLPCGGGGGITASPPRGRSRGLTLVLTPPGGLEPPNLD